MFRVDVRIGKTVDYHKGLGDIPGAYFGLYAINLKLAIRSL